MHEDTVALFLEFDYEETKDLMTGFPTVAIAVLSFSIGSADKVSKGPGDTYRSMRFLTWAWVVFLLCIVLGGLSLPFIAFASACAIYGDLLGRPCNFIRLGIWSWSFGLSAGLLFVLGLGQMALAAWLSHRPART